MRSNVGYAAVPCVIVAERPENYVLVFPALNVANRESTANVNDALPVKN